MGLGIGIIITCLILMLLNYHMMSPYKVEKEARKLGMIFPDDAKASVTNNK